MRYLFDTNVISELRRALRRAIPGPVAEWTSTIAIPDQYLSAVTIEELEIGVLLLERRDPFQGGNLRAWLHGLVLPSYAGRILPVDEVVAQRSALLHVPDPHPIRDGFIAATALVHGMTVVTRNVEDFAGTGVKVFNPWES